MRQGGRLLRHAELAWVNRTSARRRCASNWSVAREDLHAHSKACRDTRSVHTGVPLTDDPSLVGRSRGAPAGDHGCVRVRGHEYGMPQPRPCMRDSNHSLPRAMMQPCHVWERVRPISAPTLRALLTSFALVLPAYVAVTSPDHRGRLSIEPSTQTSSNIAFY